MLNVLNNNNCPQINLWQNQTKFQMLLISMKIVKGGSKSIENIKGQEESRYQPVLEALGYEMLLFLFTEDVTFKKCQK